LRTREVLAVSGGTPELATPAHLLQAADYVGHSFDRLELFTQAERLEVLELR
jgi:hypothetical protein